MTAPSSTHRPRLLRLRSLERPSSLPRDESTSASRAITRGGRSHTGRTDGRTNRRIRVQFMLIQQAEAEHPRCHYPVICWAYHTKVPE
jgi:hypothetical protein